MSIVPVIILVAILAACALTAILNGRVIVRAVSVIFAVVVISYGAAGFSVGWKSGLIPFIWKA
jgi:hypothetical protein